MPRRRDNKKRKRAAVESGDDGIGALPDAPLQQVLSFLPVDEAVRSCLLARRWRDLWQAVPDLRITNPNRWKSARKYNKFVNNLLLSRGPSPLHEFEFQTYRWAPVLLPNSNPSEEPLQYVELWMRQAISYDVRVLRVLVQSSYESVLLVNVPLISKHLTTLELHWVELDDRALDFTSCPVLEDLKLHDCNIAAHKLSSQSLKRLCITRCNIKHDFHTQISAPGQ